MTALIDLDSVLYKAVYRIVSFSSMRQKINELGKELARQWLMQEVYNEGINRCENELLKMQNYVNEIFFEEITSYELFITTCEKSFRKKLSPEYKSKRKKNKYVWMLREHYRHNGAFFSETYEADDLIAKRATEIGLGNYIIFSIDKDLKQLGGYFWSYYKTRSKDYFGDLIINEFGFYETEYKQKSIEYINERDADKFFWMQMLTGDVSDNIKGLNRVGVKTAEKILSKTTVNWFRTAREYISRGQKKDFKINYQLLKLGIRDNQL